MLHRCITIVDGMIEKAEDAKALPYKTAGLCHTKSCNPKRFHRYPDCRGDAAYTAGMNARKKTYHTGGHENGKKHEWIQQ